MEKYKVSIIITIMLSFLFLTSCASYQKYPSEWSQLILPQDKRCPDISGTYINLGERADKQPAYLTTVLGFEEIPLAVVQIQIAATDNGKLEISVWYEKTLVYKKAFSEVNKEYNCSSKGVEIPIMDRARAAVAKTTLFLAKSKDGALIIDRKSNDGDNLLLNIPMVGNSYEWYRFKSREMRISEVALQDVTTNAMRRRSLAGS
jgi:hypothetical protein